MQATANARGRRIAGQLLTGRAVEKRRSSKSDARPSTCISSKVAPSSPSIARYKLNEAEAIRRAQGGDQLMFEHLYRLHSRRVFWSKNSSCPLPYARTSVLRKNSMDGRDPSFECSVFAVCTRCFTRRDRGVKLPRHPPSLPRCNSFHDAGDLALRAGSVERTGARAVAESLRAVGACSGSSDR
jgi:hypothetical protein